MRHQIKWIVDLGEHLSTVKVNRYIKARFLLSNLFNKSLNGVDYHVSFLKWKEICLSWTNAKIVSDSLYLEVAWSTLAIVYSVTRLDNILDFGQLFKAFGNN